VGLSTIHDSFCRYKASLFEQLYFSLLKIIPLGYIEEFQELAQSAKTNFFGSTEDFFESVEKAIPAEFKINKRELNAIKNFLLQYIQLNFDFL